MQNLQSHSQSRESYERVVARLEMIDDVTRALTQSFDLEHTLDDILDKVLEVLGMGVGAIYLLDDAAQQLTLVAHRNLPPEVRDCQDGPKSARMLARHPDLHCKLAGPLRSKGETNGLLFVGDSLSCPLLRQEAELLATVCNIMGMFVANVRLYQERIRQLQVERSICQVSEEVASELELDRVLPKVMRIAVELVEADGGLVALLDEQRKVVTYPYLHHLPRDLASVTASLDEGVSGEVISTGRTVIIDDYRTYPRNIPEFVEAGLTSIAVVPIVSGDRTFGALSVMSLNATKNFAARDTAILKAIGRQAGIAIENAYLYENMRFYARKITQAQENERRRIARELHDDTIQSLIALSRRLEALVGSEEALPKSAGERIRELREFTAGVIQHVRRFSQDLRPSILDDLGLLPTLEALIADLNSQDGVQAEFRVQGKERRLSSEAELTLFRIAQEALNNVRKHAQANRVVIVLTLGDSAVKMTVQDDGKGFKPPTLIDHPTPTNTLGLVGMHERARLLGGTLVVDSAPGCGTKIVVDVPV